MKLNLSTLVSRLTLAGLAVAALALGASPLTAAEAPFKIVFIAYENPDQLLEDVRPVATFLERKLGRKVETFVATDYAAVVEALRNGSADVGFMGPLQYLLAHAHAGATPLLGELYKGKATYNSRIFVRKDSGLASPEQLRGKVIAFVDPISSSGYLYPLEIFRRAGLLERREDADRFFRRVYFAGGDEQALRAVLNGFVDAAGIGEFALQLLRGEDRSQVTSIAESPAIPSHCVVARRGLDAKTAGEFKAALLGLAGSSDKDLLRVLYNVDGYVEISHATYADAERLARDYGFLPAAAGAPSR